MHRVYRELTQLDINRIEIIRTAPLNAVSIKILKTRYPLLIAQDARDFVQGASWGIVPEFLAAD